MERGVPVKSADGVHVNVSKEAHAPEEQDQRVIWDALSGGVVSPRYRKWLRWPYRFKQLPGPKKGSEGPPT
jgi:hypothetical protein